MNLVLSTNEVLKPFEVRKRRTVTRWILPCRRGLPLMDVPRSMWYPACGAHRPVTGENARVAQHVLHSMSEIIRTLVELRRAEDASIWGQVGIPEVHPPGMIPAAVLNAEVPVLAAIGPAGRLRAAPRAGPRGGRLGAVPGDLAGLPRAALLGHGGGGGAVILGVLRPGGVGSRCGHR